MALRNVGVRLTADIANYQRQMREASRSTRDFQGELAMASKGGQLDAVAEQAAGLGLVLAGVGGTAIKLSMDFESAMSGVKAATRTTGDDLNALREEALKAGKDTQFSATEAAKGITELSKAGVAAKDILGGGLDGALDLAAAGQMGVAEAAETAASAMVQFRLKGGQVPHIADLLAAAAGKAQGTVADMGQALNQVGLIAAQTGLSIEDTTGTLGAFANAGLTGSDAGTSFKTMLQALQAPSGTTKKLMDDLGISAYDASGQFIGITALAQQLRDKLSHLTPELRDNALATIFGSDAVRAANILYREGATGIQGWIDKVNDAGYASETAATLTDNLAGDIERLKGSLETLAIESGSGANSGLRVITQGVEALVDEFGELPPAVSGTVTVLAAVGGAALLGAAGWVTMRRRTAEALAELRETGPAGEKAARGLETTTKWAGRAAAAFVALEVAAVVFDKLGNSATNVDKLTASLTDYANTGKLTEGITGAFGEDLEDFSLIANSAEQATHGFWGGLNDLTSAIPGVGSAIDSLNEQIYGTSFNDATEKMQALDESFAAFIGTQKDAAKAGEVWNRLINESGLETDQLAALLPNAWKGLQDLQAAAHGVGKGAEEAKNGVKGLGSATELTAEQVKELNDEFEKLFDTQMSVDRASIDLAQSTADLTKELTSGKRELSLNTEEGRKNRKAVLDQLAAIEDLRQARVDEGEALDVANGKYKKDVEALRKSMEQAGFTKTQIDKLIGSYEKIPKRVPTDISTPGLPAADKGIREYDKKLDDLSRRIRTEVTVEGKAKAQKELDDLLIAQQAAKKGIPLSEARAAFRKNAGYHGGGWTGPGGKYDPAGIVHADEFVIQKSSRNRIEQKHPGLLDEMNATGQLPGHAAGGLVMPFKVNAAVTQIMSMAEALSKVTPSFGSWPSSPGAQRGDSGVWRGIVQMIKATGPLSGSFGNAYRPGDPKWHGSGRAVDWMGYGQDALARFLAAKRPLELIHRTNSRDYAYTRGVNKGSFNNALMQAHRNHIHIAMANGGVIREPVYGVGASGASYSFGENWQPERVTPMSGGGGGGGNTTVINLTVPLAAGANMREAGRQIAEQLGSYLEGGGTVVLRNGSTVLP